MRITGVTLILALCIFSLTPLQLFAQYGELGFLSIVATPRAAGMGQCTINLVDEYSALYNPGALGLFHLDKTLGAFLPLMSSYLPEFSDDYKAGALGASWGTTFDISGDDGGIFSAAVAYSRFRLSLGDQLLLDGSGNIIDEYSFYVTSNNFSAALGFNYHFRFGIGASYKLAKDVLTSTIPGLEREISGDAFDYGMILEFPLMISDGRIGELHAERSDKTWFEITPSAAYVNASNGGRPEIDGEPSDFDLYHFQKFGVSIYGAAWHEGIEAASARFSWERESEIGPGDDESTRYGFELGAGTAVFARFGKVDPGLDLEYSTWGVGFDLANLLRVIVRYRDAGNGDWKSKLFRKTSLRLDYSRYETPESVWNGAYYSSLRFSY